MGFRVYHMACASANYLVAGDPIVWTQSQPGDEVPFCFPATHTSPTSAKIVGATMTSIPSIRVRSAEQRLQCFVLLLAAGTVWWKNPSAVEESVDQREMAHSLPSLALANEPRCMRYLQGLFGSTW
jgi:hypothetical protein